MKKVIVLTFLVLAIISLNSCIFMPRNRTVMFSSARSIAEKRFEDIIEALSNNDKDAIKAMFSANALSKADNFDEELDNLFDYVHGEIESWESDGGLSSPEEWNKGEHKKEIISGYLFSTDEADYEVVVYDFIDDTTDPDNIGLYSLCIVNSEENEEPDFLFAGSGDYGIIVGWSTKK